MHHPAALTRRSPWLAGVILAAGITRAAGTTVQQPTDTAAHVRFAMFSVIQFAVTQGLAPVNVLRLDNNGEIAHAARRGVPRSELQRTLRFTDSQIALLETFRLLDERNDTLVTTFPIFDPGETKRLRQWIHTRSAGLAERLAPAVGAFVQTLREIGREDNAYPMLFSYVLDGLVWNAFAEDNLVNARALTAERPLWAGEVWALNPARAFAPGTNSISEGGVALKVTWTDLAIPHMVPFVADIPTLLQMFDDYRTSSGVRHERVRQVFGPFNLFDRDGRFTIPVVVEEAGNPLYHASIKIARQTAADAPALLDLAALVGAFELRDRKQALVVAYHELMWDLMDRFEAKRLVHKPIALAEPDRARPANIADLVFIVRSPR